MSAKDFLLQILSISVFEKTQILCALQPDTARTATPPPDNRLDLTEPC